MSNRMRNQHIAPHLNVCHHIIVIMKFLRGNSNSTASNIPKATFEMGQTGEVGVAGLNFIKLLNLSPDGYVHYAQVRDVDYQLS